jgi:hypothetical protein
MKALISPNEKVYSYDGTYLGDRVAQVEPDDQIFEVAPPLFWLDCANDVKQDQFYYDESSHLIIKIPQPPTE